MIYVIAIIGYGIMVLLFWSFLRGASILREKEEEVVEKWINEQHNPKIL